MFSLYLTPAALGYLTQLILTALISGYFVFLVQRQANPPSHLRWLTTFFLGLTTFIATLFFEAALPPTPRLYAVLLQVPLLAASWLCMSQFTYRFPTLPASLRREAQASLWVSGLYTLWKTGYAVFRFIRLQAGVVEYRVDWTDYLLLLFLIWPAVVCIRELYRLTPAKGNFWTRLTVPWRRPSSREARALRNLTLVFLFIAGLSVLNILRTFYLLQVALASTAIAIGILFALFIFALSYLNQRLETTSFMVKLAGITLTVMLGILGIAGWVIAPPYIANYEYGLSAPRALRFTPEPNGGYTIAAIPYTFESALGENLHLDDGLQRGCSVALDFAFPFYGQTYRVVHVCNDGAISLGLAARYREYQYNYGAGVPHLFPLLADLDPTVSPGGVFTRQEHDRLIVTWERQQLFRHPETEFTVQAILYADGAFDFVYANAPERLAYLPNDDPGASLWAIGALPGALRNTTPQRVALTALTLDAAPISGGPEGVLQDFRLDFRANLHRLLAPLAQLILAASAFIILVFPLMFYVSLVQPLNALLNGARRVEAGESDVAVPEQAPDEIGVLTRMFNTLTAQLSELINTLEARVAARTAALDTANAHLRAEIVEREQAQMTLLEQQRLLARYEERERMGRELHDGLGQVMGYINVQAQAAQTLLETGQTEAAQNALTDLIPAAQDAHTDIRAHILGLRARETPPQDFISALRDLLKQFGRQYQIATHLSAPEPFPPVVFAPAVEEQVARILQEGLVNIRKHAHAQRAEVAISLIGDYVQLMLADDGVGFDANQRISESANQRIGESPIPNPQLPITGHFGLQIMRERAEQVGGTLEIRSAPQEGARLLLTVPRFVPTVGNAESASLQHVRLLLADDHPLFLDGLRNLLMARGMNVIGLAYDGVEVQEKARALRPDVVVMDVNMPKCNGLEATRALKAEFPYLINNPGETRSRRRDLPKMANTGTLCHLC